MDKHTDTEETAMANATQFETYTRTHRADFRNAAMVRDCKGAIALTKTGTCIRCGYPTETTTKESAR